MRDTFRAFQKGLLLVGVILQKKYKAIVDKIPVNHQLIQPRKTRNAAADAGKDWKWIIPLEPLKGVWSCQHFDFSQRY